MKKQTAALFLIIIFGISSCRGVSQTTQTPLPEQSPAVLVPTAAEQKSAAFSYNGLTFDEFGVVQVKADSPTHLEFNQRIPEEIFQKNQTLRENTRKERMDQANQTLAPFGYRINLNTSSDMMDLYQKDALLIGGISWIFPASANQSDTDFALVVEEEQGKTWLVSKNSQQDWDNSLHGYTSPVFVGDELTGVEMEGFEKISIRKGKNIVYSLDVSPNRVDNPLKKFAVWNGQWVLEVDGQLIIDGVSLNHSNGVDQIFNWQILKGKPFYFYQKGSQVGTHYGDQDLPVYYDEVIHYQCCEPAAFNPNGNSSIVWFYARKDGVWNYVEVY